MPKTTPPRHVANAIKGRGTSKRRTKEIADHSEPRGRRRAADETESGQGGSTRRGRAAGPHRGNWGGVHADEGNANARGEPIPMPKRGARDARPERDESRAGQKRSGASGPTKAPSRSRAGSSSTGRSWSGGTGTNTRRARSGSRSRGRTGGDRGR